MRSLDKMLKYMPQWEANKMYQKYLIPLFSFCPKTLLQTSKDLRALCKTGLILIIFYDFTVLISKQSETQEGYFISPRLVF